MNQALFSYIAACTSPFQAIDHSAKLLRDAGFLRLEESENWELQPGKGYYVTRNGSSMIAFRVPKGEFSGFMMTAAHCDTPGLKIKEHAELTGGGYVKLSTEKYGGLICPSWMDRPLSAAGRVLVRTEDGVESRLVDLREPVAIVPHVAIHMNRTVNDSASYNAAVDMLPLYGQEKEQGSFRSRIAAAAGVAEEDLVTTDLFLYNPQPGAEWGSLIACPRLDDLQCAFASLKAFLQAKESGSMPVWCLFDNEEVGSLTKQGASSTFLPDVLQRICEALELSGSRYRRLVANSFLASCDNAHAVHPNHPELSDKNHGVALNGGIVIKYNAGQKYTTDAVSAAIFRTVCEKAGVPVQLYANRADMPGGSTLGNLSNAQVSQNAADIGLAQLAMHSAYETAGSEDTEHMVKALTAFFETTLQAQKDGVYCLK